MAVIISNETLFGTLAVIAVPWLIGRVIRFVAARRQPKVERRKIPKPHLRTYVSLVALHSLYIAYQCLVERPINIFSLLGVPLTTPVSHLRDYSSPSPADGPSPAVDAILQKLQSFDHRTYYVRYGHKTLADCDYCTMKEDYQLYALAGPFLQYAGEAILIGILTSQWTAKMDWRGWAIGALVAAGAAEAWVINAVDIIIKPGEPNIMWHDVIWWIRHAIFALVPFVLLSLPATPEPPRPLTALAQRLNTTLHRLGLLSLSRETSLYSPQIRQRLSAHWSRAATESEWARSDPVLRQNAEATNMGWEGEESELRMRAALSRDAIWTISGVDGLGRRLPPEEVQKAHEELRAKTVEVERRAAQNRGRARGAAA